MGGKSRKSGGISRQLIAQIKSGKYSNIKKESSNEKNETRPKSLFESGRRTKN